ncbi:hypothetical protein [Phenylobacterium sp.]|uniref:hypothetical protein n=1 Tax=Phenylobacterium sp. TaxID=1871053 RepID=UPI002737BC78|nr:hypothetical protein [Phenylobacterium sp.]MDP3870356.1 hypothetical protein [Phenylobacterium sp.]
MPQDPRSFSPDTTPSGRGEEFDAEAITQDLEAEARHQGIGRRGGAPADREHGVKTRAHNKDIISGRA